MRRAGQKTCDSDGNPAEAGPPMDPVTAEIVHHSKCCCMLSIFIQLFIVQLGWIMCAMGRNDTAVIQYRFKIKIHIKGTNVFRQRSI